MRWAPIIHEFLKWLWPAIAGVLLSVSGVAVAAAGVWPEARKWAFDTFSQWYALKGNPWAWAVALLVFSVWLMAFIWSGQHSHMEENDKSVARTPAAPPIGLAGAPRLPPKPPASPETLCVLVNVFMDISNCQASKEVRFSFVYYNGSSFGVSGALVSGGMSTEIFGLLGVTSIENAYRSGTAAIGKPMELFSIEVMQPITDDEAVVLSEFSAGTTDQVTFHKSTLSLEAIFDGTSHKLPLWDGFILGPYSPARIPALRLASANVSIRLGGSR